MKQVTRLAWLFLVIPFVAASASGASLDRAGRWTASGYHQGGGPHSLRTMINDGSFEFGPPPASAWTEVSNSPLCEWIGDFSSAWYLSSWDGFLDYWACGYCIDEGTGEVFAVTSSVTQAVAVPGGSTDLSFYYASFRPDLDDNPPDGDHVYVAVNGVEIWSLDLVRANDTYPLWGGPVLVNLTPWAGQTVDLTFGGVSVGELTGNVRFDFIEFVEVEPTAAESATWGAIKTLYR